MNVQKFIFRTQDKEKKDVFIVCEGDKYGLISMPSQDDDVKGSLTDDELHRLGGTFITLPQWDDIRQNVCFDPDDEIAGEVREPDDVTCNYYVLKNGRWGILDEVGCMIQEPVYEEINIANFDRVFEKEIHLIEQGDLRYGFTYLSAGAVSGRVLVREGNRWGMLRGHGQMILPVIYDSIYIARYHWGHYNVYIVSKDGLYGVVDDMGKWYIPMEYPPLYEEGLDYMWDSTTFRIEGNDGIGYVRLGDGKCLVAPQWERIDVDRLFLAGDAEPYGHIFIVWKDGYCGLIFDDEGVIIPPVWDEIIPHRFDFADPLCYSVRKGQHWGICDAKGNLTCDAVWDEVDVIRDGTVCVKKDGKWGELEVDGHPCVSAE